MPRFPHSCNPNSQKEGPTKQKKETKITGITDRAYLPLAVSTKRVRRNLPQRLLLADKAYDNDRLRHILRAIPITEIENAHSMQDRRKILLRPLKSWKVERFSS